jgi:hypothetical protein
MRKKLATEIEKRKKFRGIFERIGKKKNFKGYSEDTILLKDIVDTDTNALVADHIWFNYSKAFEKISLTKGTQIEFEARIKEYEKGYVNRLLKINNKTKDFKLSHPTKMKVVQPGV